MAQATDQTLIVGKKSRLATRRSKIEATWVVGVILFTIARFGAAWGALADEPRWTVWAFGVIDLGTAIPYAVGVARLITGLIDRDPAQATKWGAIAGASFLAPYLWIAWVGREGNLPAAVYVALVVLVVCFGANALLTVRRKVVEGRAVSSS